jgi:S1-C subfamily serine protease
VRGPEPDAEPAPETIRTRRFSRRQLVIALTTGVAAAAVTVGLVIGLNTSPAKKPASHRPATHSGPTQPQTSGGQGLTQSSTTSTPTPTATPVSTGPTADWMGMQIVTSPSGVVVNTLKPGSPGDQAGFEPGDQIMAINGHVIGTVSELRTDTAHVQIGGPVTIAVLRQSVSLTLASIRMTQRPTIHP